MTFSFIAVGSPFPMVKESGTAKPSHTTAGYRIAESYVQSSLLVVRRGDRRGACEPEGHTQCWYRIWYIEASCQPRARSLLRCRRNFSKRHNGPAAAASPTELVEDHHWLRRRMPTRACANYAAKFVSRVRQPS